MKRTLSRGLQGHFETGRCRMKSLKMPLKKEIVEEEVYARRRLQTPECYQRQVEISNAAMERKGHNQLLEKQ